MTTFEQKYLKYKTKYLTLKNNLNNYQNGGSNTTKDILGVSELSETPTFITKETPTFITKEQSGINNIFEISNLSDTPQDNTQGGGKKKKKVSKVSSDDSDSSSNSSDAVSSSASGGSKDIKKYLAKDSSEDSSSSSDSSSTLSLSNSSDSILSALEDSLSDSI